MSAATIRSAHVLVSAELGGRRNKLLGLLDTHVTPLAQDGKLERIDVDDPAEVKQKLEPSQPTFMDLDAKNLDDAMMRPLVAGMHLRQVSNALKHLAALRRVAALPAIAAGSPRFSLVLEDDALFGDMMPQVVAGVARCAPEDADIVFLGLPSTRPAPAPGDDPVFDDPLELFKNHVVPACESYLVTQAGAAKLAGRYLPIRFSANAQLTYLLRSGVAKAYMAVPNAFVDGSKVGIVTSSLNPNNQLTWNNAYARLDALVRRTPGAYGQQQQAQFESLWDENAFKEHPDSLVLLGEHHARSGRQTDAEDAFEKALKALDNDACIINNNSDFLRKWMALYRDLQ